MFDGAFSRLFSIITFCNLYLLREAKVTKSLRQTPFLFFCYSFHWRQNLDAECGFIFWIFSRCVCLFCVQTGGSMADDLDIEAMLEAPYRKVSSCMTSPFVVENQLDSAAHRSDQSEGLTHIFDSFG